MRTNKLIWLGVGVLAVGATVVAINANNDPGKNGVKQEAGAKPSLGGTSTAQVKEVAGDTVSESLSQLQARYKAEQDANAELQKELKIQSERLNRIESKTGAGKEGDETVKKIQSEFEGFQNNVELLKDQMTQQSQKMENTTTNGYQFSSEDLGLKGGDSRKRSGYNKDQPAFEPTMLPGYVSVKPLTPGESALNGLDSRSGAMGGTPGETNNGLAKKDDGKRSGDKKKGILTPYYTIPARATLMDATAMTAMIGRVPVGGRVGDRFPVKFILGDDNLATNGLRIPGLKGIVFEGVATGNWNLSCVSVALTGATFTFHDGRIQHLPNAVKTTDEGLAAKSDDQDPLASDGGGRAAESIGYISSSQGVPCIGGQRITDAEKQLFTIGVLGAARSYFDAKAQAETTQIQALSSGLSGSVVTGDAVKFANNETAANSVQTIMDFYKDRVRDSFDVVLVNPGQSVALHITRDLLVDYNSAARKLVYSHKGGKDAKSFD